MNRELLLRLSVCLVALGLGLYSYIDKQNHLTKMRMQIPLLSKEIKAIKEENTRMQYEIDQFQSPEHLLELARTSEYSHLKHPLLKEVLTVQEAPLIAITEKSERQGVSVKPRSALAVGAKE